MPYIRPKLILERFSEFTRKEVRSSIEEKGNGFMTAQVGSMSSTMRYLSMELDEFDDAVADQHKALQVALKDAEKELKMEKPCLEAPQEAINTAQERLAAAPCDDIYEQEEMLLNTCQEVLLVVNTELSGDAARNVRRPLYDFLKKRVQTQHDMLGRVQQ